MDAQAYDVVVALIAQGHVFGEAITARLQWWVGISFALIATAHFAPERLKPTVAAFLLAIYVAFSAHTFSNMDADIRAAQASMRDATRIADARGLQLDLLDLRASDDPLDTRGATWASRIFIGGLGVGTIGFVLLTSFRTFRNRGGPA